MARYHVNPNNGNVGVCRAAPGNCPLGSEGEVAHGDDVASAARAYEVIMASNGGDQFGTIKKTNPSPAEALQETYAEADKQYKIAKATWDDPTAIHHHTSASIAKMRQQRDEAAGKIEGVAPEKLTKWIAAKQAAENKAESDGYIDRAVARLKAIRESHPMPVSLDGQEDPYPGGYTKRKRDERRALAEAISAYEQNAPEKEAEVAPLKEDLAKNLYDRARRDAESLSFVQRRTARGKAIVAELKVTEATWLEAQATTERLRSKKPN